MFVPLAQLETIVKRTPEMNAHMILAEMELNVSTELGTLIVTVLLNIEAKIVKSTISRLLVE